jgi:hypothetical protein
MKVGQNVAVKDSEIIKPSHLGVTFAIQDVVGAGADAFAALRAPDNTIVKWHRADELQPASVSPFTARAKPTTEPLGVPQKSPALRTIGKASPSAGGPYDMTTNNPQIGTHCQETAVSEAARSLTALAAAERAKGVSPRDAALRAAAARPDLVQEYRNDMDSGLRSREATEVMNLNAKAARAERQKDFAELVATENYVSTRAEAKMAAAKAAGQTMRLSEALLLVQLEEPDVAAILLKHRNLRSQM